eukprot:Pompholyxophrys_punicea_v1_NODE_64_length_3937_cov_2.858836.p8 type:complete len:110 gc:universal NODE_64_length_3937_cov_2.858836:1701-2030(+)
MALDGELLVILYAENIIKIGSDPVGQRSGGGLVIGLGQLGLDLFRARPGGLQTGLGNDPKVPDLDLKHLLLGGAKCQGFLRQVFLAQLKIIPGLQPAGINDVFGPDLGG